MSTRSDSPSQRALAEELPRERASGRSMADNAWRWSFPALFVAALLFRLQNLDMSPYGDEAYYYFITHNLGAFWNTATYPISGSTFPVFPVVYHLFAGNLESLRAANAIVGASAVPLGMLVMRDLGTGRAVTLAVEKLHSDQCIEEIADSARVQAKFRAQLVTGDAAIAEHREYA